VNQPGFYLMDEPDAPLSFIASLGLLALLHDLATEGSQAVVATHSPIVAALPGAHILELGDWGIRPVARWADLDLVQSWRAFLDDPQMYLRYLLTDEDDSLAALSAVDNAAISRIINSTRLSSTAETRLKCPRALALPRTPRSRSSLAGL